MRQHALLSASGANKWLNCPPSAILESTFPEETSEYAIEGTKAHELCEKMLTKKDYNPDEYDSEMILSAKEYVDYIDSLLIGAQREPYMRVEQRVDYSKWVPDGFGTCDCVIVAGRHLDIVDYKYGKGVPVSAYENSQMKLYALGILALFEGIYDIDNITMHIFQPRINNISTYDKEASELIAWGEGIKPIAELAYKGEGEYKQGDHCKFCKARGLCKARSEFNMVSESDMLKYDRDAHILSNDELGEVLKRAQHLKSWISDVESAVTQKLLNREHVKYFKLVAGRAVRQWLTPEDGEKAFGMLIKKGISEALLYERKQITLSQAEKLVGKKDFNALVGQFIVTPMGNPTLVSEEDKRPEYFGQLVENEFNEMKGD